MVAHNFLVPTSDQKGCSEMKDLKGELEKKTMWQRFKSKLLEKSQNMKRGAINTSLRVHCLHA